MQSQEPVDDHHHEQSPSGCGRLNLRSRSRGRFGWSAGSTIDGAEGPARFHADIVVTPERGDTPQTQVPAATVVLDAATLRPSRRSRSVKCSRPSPVSTWSEVPFHAGLPVVSARGFFGGGEADYVLLLIDGIPAIDAESGLADWSVVPLASIRRIEAARGPGASLYGDSAVGGVIQVLTNRTEPVRAFHDDGRIRTGR